MKARGTRADASKLRCRCRFTNASERHDRKLVFPVSRKVLKDALPITSNFMSD